ncbi:MAG: phage/plasmid primase, P4 family [Propionibacteriaceae bacterium]|nr:phage/plasmid primase, P4 family [Propionibacteriaceae bacterium]
MPTATSLPTYEELQIAGAMRVREEADFREALGESLSLGDLARLTINATTGLMLAQREDRKQLGREPFRPSVFLAASQAAILLLGRFEIRHVVPDGTQADDGLGLLAIYQDEGPLEGTYRRVDLGLLEELASELSPGHDKRWYAELERKLRTWAPRVSEMSDPDLVPMADCWYHYSTGEYLPFTSDRVTLSKFATRLPQTEPPVPEIVNADGTVWNAKDWFAETFVGVETLVLQIIGMCLRPAHDWRKMVYLTGKGLNGKGTLIELIRALVGVALVAMIPPSQFGGRFNVSQAIGKRVNLVDEDDVGAFIEAAAVLKQVISRDPVMMDRKHKDPIAVRLLMSIIVSINEVSQKFKDRTTAMDDRQVFVPMPGRFAGAAKNPAIKNDYVKRPEVREWFAYQALVALPKYWALEESEASLAAKDAAKADTDFTVAYWEEFGDRWERPFLPYDLLYAHYRAWRSKVNPGGKPEAQKVVTARLKELVDPEQWVVATNASGRDAELTLNQWLLTNEPVLAEFDYLPEVANWDYGTKYANGTYLPVPTEWMLKKEKARGFVRREVWVVYRADGRTPRALHVEAERNGSVPPPRASEGEIADVMTLIEIADRGEAMAAPSKELEPFSEEDRAANPGIKL